jgi:hypothetical protein
MSGRAIAETHTPELLAHAGALHDQRLSKRVDISIDAMHNDLQRILKTSSKPILANCSRRVTSRYLSHNITELVDGHWYYPQAREKSNGQGIKELWRQGGRPVGPESGSLALKNQYGGPEHVDDSAKRSLSCAGCACSDRATFGSPHECGSSTQS